MAFYPSLRDMDMTEEHGKVGRTREEPITVWPLAGVHGDAPMKHLGLIDTDSIDHERGLLIGSIILEARVTFPRVNDLKFHGLSGRPRVS